MSLPYTEITESGGHNKGDHRDPSRAAAFAVFAAPALDHDRHDPAAVRQLIRDRFGDLGWWTPRLLAGLDTATDLYLDQICRVDVDGWSAGRVVLLGDAACGATIGGMGNGTALVAAYVLAGELATAGGDHRVAFPAYERRVGAFARRAQKGGDTTGAFLAPRTARGIRARNWAMNRGPLLNLMMRIGRDRSTRIDLPPYPALNAACRPTPR